MDVQFSHGHIRIANSLYDALLCAGLAPIQFVLMHALIRTTYGWGKKTVRLSHPQIADVIGASDTGSLRAQWKELIENGLILVIDPKAGKPNLYAVQKDPERWGRFAVAKARIEARYTTRPPAEDHRLLAYEPQSGDVRPARPQADTLPAGGQAPCPPAGRSTPRKSKKQKTSKRGKTGKTGQPEDQKTFLTAVPPQDAELNGSNGAKPKRVTWLTPIADAWEASAGAGSFSTLAGQAAKACQPLIDAGTTPEGIGKRLRKYLRATESRFWSITRFAQTFADWAPKEPTSTAPRSNALASPELLAIEAQMQADRAEYQQAQYLAGARWAKDHPDDFEPIRRAVDGEYHGKTGRAASDMKKAALTKRCADEAKFPTFDDWRYARANALPHQPEEIPANAT